MRIPINGDSMNENSFEHEVQEKQSIFLNSVALLKYFLGVDDYIDTLITCKGTELDLKTYDYNLYEALGAIKPYDDFRINKLVKLLESVNIMSYKKHKRAEKKILTERRIEELRKEALKKED